MTESDPAPTDSLARQAAADWQAGRQAQAAEGWRRVLEQDPTHFAALHGLGLAAHLAGRDDEAADWIARAVAQRPAEVDALYNLGVITQRLGRHETAEDCYRRVLALRPEHLAAHGNLALVLAATGRSDAVIDQLRQAAALCPGRPDPWFNLGNGLRDAGQPADALDSYGRALAVEPMHAGAAYNLANLLRDEKRNDAAIAAYQALLARHPGHVDGRYNLANVLLAERRLPEAVQCFRQLLEQAPTHADAWHNLGVALQKMGELEQAAGCFQTALGLQPGDAVAWFNLGMAREFQGRRREAATAFARAIEQDPALTRALGHLIMQLRHLADWTALPALEAEILRCFAAGQTDVPPFVFIGLPADALAQRRCAEAKAAEKARAVAALPPPSPRRPGRLRVGYLSGDFHGHATAWLMAELFELHDRSRFEVTAYSCGPDDSGPERTRLQAAVEHFVDLRALSDMAAAQRIRADGIDLLIDLKGYTFAERFEILTARPAPLQAAWLGYPGTTGAACIDYLIADAHIIPPGQEAGYSEQVVRLPDCYQPNDRRRAIDPQTPARAACGLPETGFVFCCFNQSYKITPEVFACWMRLLGQVPGSVLWLLEWNDEAPGNLRREAAAHGMDPARLIFAPKLPLPQHLARYRIADLFLDTFPVGAHTTASDALWAGLPLLAIDGDTFVSRVAGSVLQAAGLPELVTANLAEYEALALALARDPQRLQALRARLAQNRDICPLFDTPRLVRYLEATFTAMAERHAAGLPPAPIDVPQRATGASDQPQTAAPGAARRQPPRRPQRPLPHKLQAKLDQAVRLHQAGDLDAALALYAAVLKAAPGQAHALHLSGVARYQQGALDDALQRIREALAAAPGEADFHCNHGNVLQALGRHADARQAYAEALRLAPGMPAALCNLGAVLKELGEIEAARTVLRDAVQRTPGLAQAWNNLGIVEARAGDVPAAKAAYSRAISLDGGFADAWQNLGAALEQEGDVAGAETACRQATALNPHLAGARYRLAMLLVRRRALGEALTECAAAVRDDPEHAGMLSDLILLVRQTCRWSDLPPLMARLAQQFAAGRRDFQPFVMLCLTDDPLAQRQCAEARAAEKARAVAALPPPSPRRPGRLRVGYLSGDFHGHATAWLMAELFELHDRSRFEVTAYSYGPDDSGPERARLQAAVEHFVDLRALSDAAAAQRIRADGIDLLIDLKGYTFAERFEILAARPAPLQAAWLGYPGTTGAACIDYLIADAHIIPPGQEAGYSEQVVRLPDCYQPNDRQRAIAPQTPSRTACGLPETGFVFCCFNQSYKITPEVFACWMRLLEQVPGSVLWLLEWNDEAPDHLRRAAAAHGMDPARLVFGPGLPQAAHLARCGLADLFLDTFPVGAHTTASDALWAGLPVLAIAGNSFISRVSGSVLQAAGLPELVTANLAEYEALALALARDPHRLQALRQRLAANRLSCPLFDAPRLVHHLESAFTAMADRQAAGQPPAPVEVPARD